MGGGFGILKYMNDVIKYNRDILGKRKSARELYKEEIKSRKVSYSKEELPYVRERVERILTRNRTMEIIAKSIAICLVIVFVSGIAWALVTIDFSVAKEEKYKNKDMLFKTEISDLPGGLQLKVDYYWQGPKASETLLKDGLKHLTSESYYGSGEKFRSAQYYNDTLVTEAYFFKSGDTIRNFPEITDNEIHHFKLLDTKDRKKIEFDLFDGKIIQDSYLEIEAK